jgi:preprotein translocase subunit YajC
MFMNVAYAQAAGGAAPAPSAIEQFLPFIVVFVIFYFLIIRPQGKKVKVHSDFISKLKRGDSVLTSSGILGTIEGLTEKFVTLEVADGVRIRILKSQISSSSEIEEKK